MYACTAAFIPHLVQTRGVQVLIELSENVGIPAVHLTDVAEVHLDKCALRTIPPHGIRPVGHSLLSQAGKSGAGKCCGGETQKAPSRICCKQRAAIMSCDSNQSC